MIVYKVVSIHHGWLSYCHEFMPYGTKLLRYYRGKKTVAPAGSLGIFVFKAKEDALLFAGQIPAVGILKAKTHGKIKSVNGYENKASGLIFSNSDYWLVPAITPIERIK